MKLGHYFIAFFITSLCGGCLTSESKKLERKIYYFDLKTFFEGEIIRLNGKKTAINKTVLYNKQSEKKQIIINNWATELALFTESDINKTAFKNSYSKDSTATKIIYIAKNQNLKTQSITIYLQNHQPILINIVNQQKNYLFNSSESLRYYPTKAYVIEKKQKLVFGNADFYKVKGVF